MKAKVLIIGGGIMGNAIALETARATDPLSAPVVLLERRAMGAGSSGRSGAILRQHYGDKIVAAMARDSLRAYASFESRTGRSIGFQRTGVLTIAGPGQPEWQKRIRANVEMLREMRIETRIVEVGEIRGLFPGIRVEPGTIGAWEPDSGTVDPVAALDGFAAIARTYGAVTRLGVEVSEIVVEGGRAVGARTSEGDYTAEVIVLAAGPWSERLLRRAGVDLPLRCLRPENHFLKMLHSDVEVEEPRVQEEAVGIGFDLEDPLEKIQGETLQAPDVVTRGMHPVVIDVEYGFYARCEPADRRTRVGRIDYGHDEVLDDPDRMSEEVGEATRLWAREALASRLPDYRDQPDAGSLAGWYTLTPDAQALIGLLPAIDGLFVVTGFSGHGFKLAPSVGEGVRQMLFEQPITAFEPEFFSPARFRGGEEWHGAFGL